jgi:hypothetical protein
MSHGQVAAVPHNVEAAAEVLVMRLLEHGTHTRHARPRRSVQLRAVLDEACNGQRRAGRQLGQIKRRACAHEREARGGRVRGTAHGCPGLEACHDRE